MRRGAVAGRMIAISALLAGVCLAQETPRETPQPVFRAQTDLVVVPFQVRRGSSLVSNLEPTDVVLFEDGRPRAFTGFEAPSARPTLELVVMFDVTDVRQGGFWSANALDDVARFWNDAAAQALLTQPGATIRFSVYQFNQFRLRRLVRSTSDPTILLDALRRVSGPIPADQTIALQLPPGTVVRSAERLAGSAGTGEPQPWVLAGALTALHDSAAGPGVASRALVIISPGGEATSITPTNLADAAVAADVPVYPVVLPSNYAIWYEDSPPEPFSVRLDPAGGPNIGSGGALPQWGFCHPERRGRPPLESELQDCPLNVPFAHIGTQTGGGSFEAVRRPGFPKLPQGGEGVPLDRFSMTGTQVHDVLEAATRHALARVTSTYRVWFSPPPSASPRTHTLEVKLAAKTGGSITGGKKRAIY